MARRIRRFEFAFTACLGFVAMGGLAVAWQDPKVEDRPDDRAKSSVVRPIFHEDIRAWLETRWPEARKHRDELTALRRDHRSSINAWDHYGLGLAALKAREYRAASELMESSLRLDSNERYILKSFIYTKILTREPQAAVARLSQHAETLFDRRSDKPIDEANNEVEFLGLIVGFLELPSTVGVNQRELELQIKAIHDILSAELKTEFDTARVSVRELYDTLTLEKAVEREIATDAAEKEREATLATLADERQVLDNTAAQLEPQIDQLRDDRAQALDEISAKDEPLVERLAALSTEVAVIERDLVNYDRRISALLVAITNEPDRLVRRRLRLEADRLILLSNDVEADLVAVRGQAAGVVNQRTVLQQRYQDTQARFDNQLSLLDADWQQVRRQQMANDVKTQRAARPAKASSGRAAAYGQKARTFSTYYEFPLEIERLRLLDAWVAPAVDGKVTDSIDPGVGIDLGEVEPKTGKPKPQLNLGPPKSDIDK